MKRIRVVPNRARHDMQRRKSGPWSPLDACERVPGVLRRLWKDRVCNVYLGPSSGGEQQVFGDGLAWFMGFDAYLLVPRAWDAGVDALDMRFVASRSWGVASNREDGIRPRNDAKCLDDVVLSTSSE